MNNVTLVGRITKTPELRTIASGHHCSSKSYIYKC